MSRVKYCPACDEVLPWEAETCKACGAEQPADPAALARVQHKKERELARLRQAARAEPGRHRTEPVHHKTEPAASAKRNPTARAASWGIALLILSAILVTVGGFQRPPAQLPILLGWIALAAGNLALLWMVIYSAVACAIRTTRED